MKILGSESFARWLVSLALALVLGLVLALALEIDSTRDTSACISSARASARASASASTRDRAIASARHRALPYHCISQSFDLPPATTSVSHLTCPLPPHQQSELALALALEIELVLALDIEHYGTTASVSHLTCPLQPHQSVIWLAHCHHIISQSWH